MKTKDASCAKRIGKRIKDLRSQNNISQQQLAESLGITPQAVSRWECGTSLPDSSKLPAIARVFGITIDEIFE